MAVPSIFHAVRRMTYASNTSRSPEDVLISNRGACTGKHLLLRDLLRRAGEEADVEIAQGDFAANIPIVLSMPEILKQRIQAGGVIDFHCYVVWRTANRELKLDATWPDSLAPLGFPVNDSWDGRQDTQLALEPFEISSRVEDVIGHKEQLLSTLSSAQIDNRRFFLDLLTNWLLEEKKVRENA